MTDVLGIGSRTSEFIKQLGVKSLAELAALEVIRAPSFILAELQEAFRELGVNFKGKFEEQLSLVPYNRVIPRFDIIFTGGNTGAPVSRVGGMPNDTDFGLNWPNCRGCNRPMHFVGQIVGPFSLPQIQLGSNEAVQMFACLWENSHCRSWEQDSGANAALVVPGLDVATRHSTAPPLPAQGMSLRDGFDDVIITDMESVPDEDMSEYIEALFNAQGNKLGGIAAVAGNYRNPVCSSCDADMVLLAQLDDEVVPNPFGEGFCFVHICPHKHSAKMEFMRLV